MISLNPNFLPSKPTNLVSTVGRLKSPSINNTLFAFSSDRARLKAKVVFPSDGFEEVIKKLLCLHEVKLPIVKYSMNLLLLYSLKLLN